jgi:hypothetical protein
MDFFAVMIFHYRSVAVALETMSANVNWKLDA